MPGDPTPLLTTNDVCDLLRVSRTTVVRWTKNGTLPSVRIGHSVRYRADVVDALIRRSEVTQ